MGLFNANIIAHRGASSIAPENTLVAFKKANELGCKAVELDVRLSADGKLFVFHDDTLDRTTNANGRFFDYPETFLRNLDAGSWFSNKFSGERIPTLEETLEFFKNKDMLVNVELKADHGHEKELAQKVSQIVQPYLNSGKPDLLFSSFSLPTLTAFAQQCPNSKIGFLLDEWQSDWEAICNQLKAVSVHLNKEIVTPQRVKAIKETGRDVYVFTVDDYHLAKALVEDLHVDAIFSNHLNNLK